MLQVEQLSVFYGDVQVIFDLSLTVGAGEIVTLIGSNGAGKTTTVNAISGVHRTASGRIRFLGQPIEGVPAHVRVARGLVQVPEGRMLYPLLSVHDNLKLGAYPRGCRPAMRGRMEWVFTLFPRLEERQEQLVRTLSGGEAQMVAIGRGLMSFPKLLILDEPSIGLAPTMVSDLFEVIRKINLAGVAVLLIEQNAVQALRLAHRGYVMEHGHTTHEGDSKVLLNDDTIRSAYLGI
jgi:branched-chain amino acid transport system ATP-binding protein